MTPAIEKAKEFAIAHHGEQRYGARPYAYHLAAVGQVLTRFGVTIRHGSRSELLHVGAWLHDVVEDTVASTECIAQTFGADVAALVHAVTDEPGSSRTLRKLRTYPKIRRYGRDAVVLKVADRIANVESSRIHRPGLFVRYQAEQREFCHQLHKNGECDDMWYVLNGLLQYGVASVKRPRMTAF